MAYTYDDFLKAANSSGTLNRFSQEDLTAAQKNPEYGLSMVSLMKEMSGAKTTEQQLLATTAAQQLRKNYGVSGSGNGYASSYGGQIQNLMNQVESYGSFDYQNQGEYDKLLGQVSSYGPFQYAGQGQLQQTMDKVNNYGSFQYSGQDQLQQTMDKVNNYGSFQYSGQDQLQQALETVNNYGPYSYGNETIYQQLLNSIINQQPFSYDHASDPSFSAYKKACLREGDRASANALAQASAASGGQVSSYAAQAAQQANNYYAGQLADIIPTLEQNAYQRYLADAQSKLSKLSAMQSDRAFDYQTYQDGLAQLQNVLANLQNERAFEQQGWQNGYQILQNALANLQNERAFEQQGWQNGYQILQNALANLQSDRDFEQQGWQNGYQILQSGLGAMQTDRESARQDWLTQYDMLQNALTNAQNQDATDYQRYLDQYEMGLQADQDAFADQQYADQMAQQEWANAFTLYQLLGYATPEIAQILGIEPGSPGAVENGSSGSGGGSGGGDVVGGDPDPEEQTEPVAEKTVTNATGVDGNGVEWVNVGGQIMDWSMLAQMIASGKVKEVYNEKTGKYTYQYVGSTGNKKTSQSSKGTPSGGGSLNVVTAGGKSSTPYAVNDGASRNEASKRKALPMR